MELWIERGIFVWPSIGFCSLALLNPHGASAVPKGQWWLSNMWWITVMHRGFDFKAWMFICTIFATDQTRSPHSKKKNENIIREYDKRRQKLCIHVKRKLLTCVWLRFVLLHINDVACKNAFFTMCRPVLMRGTRRLCGFNSAPQVFFSFCFYAHYWLKKNTNLHSFSLIVPNLVHTHASVSDISRNPQRLLILRILEKVIHL